MTHSPFLPPLDPATGAMKVTNASGTQGTLDSPIRTEQVGIAAVQLVDADGNPVGISGGPTTVTDGADVTQGAIADVKVDTDASGTVNSHLRGAVSRLASLDAKIPMLGPAYSSGSLPVVLPDSQVASIAITNYAIETGGNLGALASMDFATQATLAAIKAKTDLIDVALSTRSSPQQAQSASLDDVLVALRAILSAIVRPLANNPATGRPVVEVAAAQTLATVTTCSTVTTCGTVTTVNQLAGNDVTPVIPYLTRLSWADNVRGRIS